MWVVEWRRIGDTDWAPAFGSCCQVCFITEAKARKAVDRLSPSQWWEYRAVQYIRKD